MPVSSLSPFPILREPDSPIEKTTAIVLQIFPFSNTSQMVVWLTQDGTRLLTAIKGAARPKSFFLGQLDFFQTCELLYYRRTKDGVHAPRECTALLRRDHLRVNWRAEHSASWFAALANIAAASDTPQPELFRLLDDTLSKLDSCGSQTPPSPLLFAAYEARLLCTAGLRPNFERPAPPDPAPHPQRIRFNLAEGRIAGNLMVAESDSLHHFIPDAKPQPRDPILNLSPEAVELFECLTAPRAFFSKQFPETTPATVRELLRFLGLFIRFHLPDAPTAGRALALASLHTPRFS